MNMGKYLLIKFSYSKTLEHVGNKERILILSLNIIKRSLMKSKDWHLYDEKEKHSNIQ